MIAKTPLYSQHLAQQAHMVNFHGWEMPLHYGSQLEEHHAVRNSAGMFDVSHMTIVDILGAGGRQFLRRLLANDVDKLSHTGKALYSCMCDERGGIIDDLIVYQRSSDCYRLILNSATKDQDLAWIERKSEGFSVGLQVRPELSMLAVQGPEAISKVMSILTPAQNDSLYTLGAFSCTETDNWFFARTGYTGEDGLEIIMPEQEVVAFWQKLLAAGVVPCGLGARDTLRLEAGFLLYGQDMDRTTTPLESGLAWTVALEPASRDFIGMGALLSQKHQHAMTRKLVGLILEDKGIMRTGQTVYTEQGEGIITSGGYSPTLLKSIALARIPTGETSWVKVGIRDKLLLAKVGKPRFVKDQKIIWS